jgi:GNAT superfamily N-acetyltransferase
MAAAPLAIYEETAESVAQWAAMYRTFFANPHQGGETLETPGLLVACAGTLLPLCNGAVFTSEIEDEADLEERIATASRHFAGRGLSGVFSICEALIPSALRAIVPATFARFGYVPTMPMTGMATDELLPPVRPLSELRYRAVKDPATVGIVAVLNVLAYGMPPEWGPDWAARTDVSQIEAFGFIGYLGNQPVTCAVTIPLEGRLYVALVATDAAHRGRGYAEAVMRHSLGVAAKRTGLARTILHASDMGYPIYARMGYHDTARFALYGLKPQ